MGLKPTTWLLSKCQPGAMHTTLIFAPPTHGVIVRGRKCEGKSHTISKRKTLRLPTPHCSNLIPGVAAMSATKSSA